MIYTVILYSVPDGGTFEGVAPGDTPDQAVLAVVARHSELSMGDIEVVAVIRGHAQFEPVSPSIPLFPSAPYMDPYETERSVHPNSEH